MTQSHGSKGQKHKTAGLPKSDQRGKMHLEYKDVQNKQTRPKRSVGSLALSLFLLLAVPGLATASQKGSDKFDTPTKEKALKPSKSRSISIIVKYDGELTTEKKNKLGKLGVDIVRNLPVISSIAVKLPERNLNKLAELCFVSRVSFDGTVKKTDFFTVGGSMAEDAWAGNGANGGFGVTVAVIDSGISQHKDFGALSASTNRLLASVSFATNSPNNNDGCGHGTHVAGIVAGSGYVSQNVSSMAPIFGIARSAGLVSVKVLDSVGQGSVSDVLAGVQWVIDHKAQYNIRVVNMSLGHPVGESYTTDPLCQAVEAAWKSGIVVVCAAGNEGRLNSTNNPVDSNEGWGTNYGSIQVPGNDPYVITVGAMKSMNDTDRSNDKVATYSSRGPSRLDYVLKPDVVAPGNRVLSTLATGYLSKTYARTNLVSTGAQSGSGSGIGAYYFYLSGTSMAAPVVAGGAALMLQADPTLTPDTVKARIMVTADKWAYPNGEGDICTFGAGYVNFDAALKSPLVATGYAMSPMVMQVTDELTGAEWLSLSFGGNLSGSFNGYLGTDLTDLRAIWGNRAIWGDGSKLVDGNRAIWGSGVWGDRAIWGVSTSKVDLTSIPITGE